MGTDERNGGFCSKAKSHLKIRNLLRKLGKLQNFAGPSTKSNRNTHEVMEDPRRNCENYETNENCENDENSKIS